MKFTGCMIVMKLSVIVIVSDIYPESLKKPFIATRICVAKTKNPNFNKVTKTFHIWNLIITLTLSSFLGTPALHLKSYILVLYERLLRLSRV